ncbi:hypothetical protein PI172_0307 [Prevotella intermedia]|uniref:Uncharacterized protein n=1 Tax=Prevotella intermedia TaxID=28131 RepID=A0AAD1BGQ3_PREIN|nr:hypothetical protein PI172_0307 [Prevotella intermedia]
MNTATENVKCFMEEPTSFLVFIGYLCKLQVYLFLIKTDEKRYE